jgi:Tol biopolymer transport system component
VDLNGHKKTVTRDLSGTLGLAWSPDGTEIYFASRETTHQMVVLAAKLDGTIREALNGPGDLTLHDVAKDGEWLVSRDVHTDRVLARGPNDSVATVVASWLDYAWLPVLSGDGRQLAVSDASSESGDNYSIWLRSSSGGRLARIGDGWPRSFTTDGSAVLAVVPTQPAKLVLYPTGAGNERPIPTPFATIDDAGWLIADSSVYICGHGADKTSRCVVEDLKGSQAAISAAFARAIGSEWPSPLNPLRVSPDGRSIAVKDGAGYTITDIATGAAHKFAGRPGDLSLVRWNPDGRALWVLGGTPPELQRIDVATSSRTTLMAAVMPNATSTLGDGFSFSDDHRTFAFVNYVKASDLFIVSGAH